MISASSPSSAIGSTSCMRRSVLEEGPVDRLFAHPAHPYTQMLLRATPTVRTVQAELLVDSRPDSPALRAAGGLPLRRSLPAPRSSAARASRRICSSKPDTRRAAGCWRNHPPTRPRRWRREARMNAPILQFRGVTKIFESGLLPWTPATGPRRRCGQRRSASRRDPRHRRRVRARASRRCCASPCAWSARAPARSCSRGATSRRWRGSELKAVRRRMQAVFQDPTSSFNPRQTVGQILLAPLEVHGIGAGPARRNRSARRWSWSASTPASWSAIRTSFRAASASASRSRAPSSCGRPWSWPTSRPRRSTFPCRRRS